MVDGDRDRLLGLVAGVILGDDLDRVLPDGIELWPERPVARQGAATGVARLVEIARRDDAPPVDLDVDAFRPGILVLRVDVKRIAPVVDSLVACVPQGAADRRRRCRLPGGAP